jgi:protein TonB
VAQLNFETNSRAGGVYSLDGDHFVFEDSLIVSRNTLKRRSPWVTAVSFLMEIVLIGILVLFPLVFTDALPKIQPITYLVAPTSPPPPPPPPAAPPAAVPATVRTHKVVSEMDGRQLLTPTAFPKTAARIREEDAPAMAGGVVGGVVGGVPGGVVGGVLGGEMSSIPHILTAAPKVAVPQKVRISSGIAQGNLIHDVKTPYPAFARQAHIQGLVILQAVIGKDGTIQNLRVVSGNPMLAQAALEAVKQWRYKPYYLNGEPVEVDTTININFTLSGG